MRCKAPWLPFCCPRKSWEVLQECPTVQEGAEHKHLPAGLHPTTAVHQIINIRNSCDGTASSQMACRVRTHHHCRAHDSTPSIWIHWRFPGDTGTHEGFYLHLYFWSFDSTLTGTPSHPVCIEGLHSGDDTILRRCCAVAALTGGKQDKSLSSCILRYGRDAVDRERVAQEQELLRGSSTYHMMRMTFNPQFKVIFCNKAVSVCGTESLLPTWWFRLRFRFWSWESRHGRGEIPTYNIHPNKLNLFIYLKKKIKIIISQIFYFKYRSSTILSLIAQSEEFYP